MSEQPTLAASSPAEQADVFGGQQPTFSEFSEYRKTGELPARFKPAEATTDAPEETVETPAVEETETDSESDPGEDVQEPTTAPTEAQKRIKELLAKVKELERKQQPAPKPVEQQQQAPQPPVARTKPKPEGNSPDGKPYATYEDYLEDLTDWKAEQHVARYKQEVTAREQQQQMVATVEEGKAIYGADFGEVADNAAGILGADKDLPQIIRDRFRRSDVLPHLVYVMAGEEEGLTKFLALAKSDPFRALDYITLTESGIRESLGKTKAAEPGSGTAPEKKPTQAPKPPQPVSGVTTRGFDVSDESLSADDWMKKRQAQIDKRKKG